MTVTVTSESALVGLGDEVIARLERFDDGGTFELGFEVGYRRTPPARRAVLGQFFEDRALAPVRTESFPAWFANLLPERGPYRAAIARALHIEVTDHWGLLLALGEHLPGAVRVASTSSEAPRHPRALKSAMQPPLPLGVSLAGVQAKLSVHDDDDGKLVVPVAAGEGQAIAKFHDPDHPRIVHVEYATTLWARACGVPVPDVRLIDARSIGGLPPTLFDLGDGAAFLTRRFDRVGELRVHMEDFAQIFDRPPGEKYDEPQRHLHYEEIGAVVAATCGDPAFLRFLDQLVFCVVCGNTDAHLKNFSVLYVDRRTPDLSPAYDLVAAVVYEQHAEEMALRLGGTRRLADIDVDTFMRITRFAVDPAGALVRVRDFAVRARRLFADHGSLFAEDDRQRIEAHLARLPLGRS